MEAKQETALEKNLEEVKYNREGNISHTKNMTLIKMFFLQFLLEIKTAGIKNFSAEPACFKEHLL